MPSFSAAITSVDDDEDEPQTAHIKKKPQNDVLQIKKPIIAPKPIAQAISQQPKSILTQPQNPVKNALKLIRAFFMEYLKINLLPRCPKQVPPLASMALTI